MMSGIIQTAEIAENVSQDERSQIIVAVLDEFDSSLTM